MVLKAVTNKKIYISYFVFLFLMSHVFLDLMGRKDFLMIFKWNLFSGSSVSQALEIRTADKYLLRDKVIKDKTYASRIFIATTRNSQFQLRWFMQHSDEIKIHCLCDSFELVDTGMDIIDYYLYRKKIINPKVVMVL